MQIELEGAKQDEDYEGVFYSPDPYIQLINLARSKEMDPIKFYNLPRKLKVGQNIHKFIIETLTSNFARLKICSSFLIFSSW